MGDDPNMPGNSRRWIHQACDASLRRLGTGWIDVYQAHRHSPEIDLDETLGVLIDLVPAGKVPYLGSSTFSPSAIVEARWVAERRGRERFVCEQSPPGSRRAHNWAALAPRRASASSTRSRTA